MQRLWIAICAPVLCAQIIPGRYIVELPARSEQARVRPQLERLGARVLGHVQTVANMMVVEIPDISAPRLRTVPGARIHPVRAVRPLLDHALPLHKIPDAWALVGGSANAGAGIKIGIIDSGIDQTHPAFQDSTLSVPPGFPRANQAGDLAYTNRKVIVARNYVPLATPQDGFGHGTAVAMEAAGLPNSGPLGSIAGVAPKAWLGSYKVFQDENPFGEDTVLQAIEDAVNDGMDVINLSLGVPLAGRLADDVLVAAVERAAALGVIVCVAAGNYGSAPGTITSPATAPSAIAVGASYNDRVFAPGLVSLGGAAAYYAIPGANGPAGAAPISAPLADVSLLDSTGQACVPLPAHSLTGSIALIERSTQAGPACSFAAKLNNAQSAGAIAAVVYMNPDSPGLVGMDVRGSTLPAVSVDYTSGTAIRSQVPASAMIQFTTSALAQSPNLIAPFSSRGPNLDASIKPDLLATGTFLYTATQRSNQASPLYAPTGYLKEADGTSFAAPLVAGAAALLKGARPGLTAAQYRSLLVNSASPMPAAKTSAVETIGSAVLDAAAAVTRSTAVLPVSLSFGAGPGVVDLTQTLTITNLGAAETFTLSAVPAGAGPVLSFSSGSVNLAAGASQQVTARLNAFGLGPGQYQGYIHIRAAQTAADTLVPYWYGVRDDLPNQVTMLAGDDAAPPGSIEDIYFRVTDRSGLPLAAIAPTVNPSGPLGSVLAVTSIDNQSPGVFHAVVMLGMMDGPNVFRIGVGPISKEVTIQAVTR